MRRRHGCKRFSEVKVFDHEVEMDIERFNEMEFECFDSQHVCLLARVQRV